MTETTIGMLIKMVQSKSYENEVQKGIQLGTVLGKKLQKGEDRSTVFNDKVGKIDKNDFLSWVR